MEITDTVLETVEVVETVTSQYTIYDACLLLANINNTLNTLLALVLLLICIRFLWLVFAKWLFGGA